MPPRGKSSPLEQHRTLFCAHRRCRKPFKDKYALALHKQKKHTASWRCCGRLFKSDFGWQAHQKGKHGLLASVEKSLSPPEPVHNGSLSPASDSSLSVATVRVFACEFVPIKQESVIATPSPKEEHPVVVRLAPLKSVYIG